MNAVVIRFLPKALVKRCRGREVQCLHLNGREWVQSLLRQMGFVRKMVVSSQVEIPDDAQKEAELTYLNKIVCCRKT